MERLALTIDEAVKAGGPKRSKLYDEIRKGRLRAVKSGRSTRILIADFQSYLASLFLAILKIAHETGIYEFAFAGAKPGRPLSGMALLMLLRRMGRNDVTVHGFRSSFRDWAAERSNYPREVAEMAVAHAIPSAVEAAYRRSDLFDKRQRLMQAWAEYCGSAGASNVVPLRKAATHSRP